RAQGAVPQGRRRRRLHRGRARLPDRCAAALPRVRQAQAFTLRPRGQRLPAGAGDREAARRRAVTVTIARWTVTTTVRWTTRSREPGTPRPIPRRRRPALR